MLNIFGWLPSFYNWLKSYMILPNMSLMNFMITAFIAGLFIKMLVGHEPDD